MPEIHADVDEDIEDAETTEDTEDILDTDDSQDIRDTADTPDGEDTEDTDEDGEADESPAKAESPAEVEPALDGLYTIIADGLSKHFEDGDEIIKAVDGVTFTCSPEQFVTISGPSGCGKSTLLFLLGTLEQPTEGRLIVDGEEVTELPSGELNRFRRSRVGFVFQSFHLIPNLSALENVMLPMDIAGVPRREQPERAAALLEQVGIAPDRHEHRPGKLSGGQQQRVAIARALANDPAVILADEPTGNLDSGNSKRIVELLRQLARQGRTVVVVTHDRSIAKQSDLSIELEDGRIIRMATKEERERRAQEIKEQRALEAAKAPKPTKVPTRASKASRRGRR